MGDVVSSDRSGQLTHQPPLLNVHETKSYTPLSTVRGVESQFAEKVFQYENYKRLEVTYKFFPNVYVHLELVK